MLWYQAVLFGCAGGLLPDILGVVKERHGPPPEYLSRRFFWISLLILAGIGGLVSYLSDPARLIDALAIGYSAPTIISKGLGKEGPPDIFEPPPPPPKMGTSFAGKDFDSTRKVPREPKLRPPHQLFVAQLRSWWGSL